MRKQVYVSGLEDLRPDAVVEDLFLVQDRRASTTRAGDPYLNLVLADRTGTVRARKWASTPREEAIEPGTPVFARARVSLYQGQRQLVVESLEPLPGLEGEELAELLPPPLEPAVDLAALGKELEGVIRGVASPHLRALLESLLLGDGELAEGYRRAPASLSHHHAYVGGLLDHSLQLVRLARAVAPLYPPLQVDVLVAAALLHDLGKVFEYEYDSGLVFTTEGRLRGHIQIGHSLVDRACDRIAGFPPELRGNLLHCILAHHGQADWGSPVPPRTLEAQVLHCLDLLDGRAQPICDRLQEAYRTGAGPWAGRDVYVGDVKFRFEPYPTAAQLRLREVLRRAARPWPGVRAADRLAGLEERLGEGTVLSPGARERLRERAGRVNTFLLQVNAPLAIADVAEPGGEEERAWKAQVAAGLGVPLLAFEPHELAPLAGQEGPSWAECFLHLWLRGRRGEEAAGPPSPAQVLAAGLEKAGLSLRWGPDQAALPAADGGVAVGCTLQVGSARYEATAEARGDLEGVDPQAVAREAARCRCLLAALARRRGGGGP